jgi:hypothetical protein
LQPGHVLRERRDVGFRGRQHQIGHAGIVAAAARAEVQHRLLEIFPVLAGDAGLGAFALVLALVAAGTPD